ncbi:17975_t:CDS:1 [Funneliformis geosporum]|nr:17975_t:CDS:1 [Funneliformis geosporum]
MIPDYIPKHIIFSSRNKIDSTIINLKHTVQFANWIDRMEGDAKYVKSIPYKFDLIYRASRDGNTVAAFHEKCNNEGATMVVAKIKGSEQLAGGYNPLGWSSNKLWKHTFESFIFSMKNRRNLQTSNVGYCKNNKYSLGCDPQTGPNFYDLRCQDTKIWNYENHHCYPKIDLPSSFYVDDYEVFTVTTKPISNMRSISETNQISQTSNDEACSSISEKFNLRSITGKFHIKKNSLF